MCPHVLHALALPEVSEGSQVMSQAQKNQEPAAQVRTTPPPLPRPSHIAPVATQARSMPTPPPLAAARSLPSPPKPSNAPRLSVPPPAHLALVPLWDDANLSLRPVPKSIDDKIRWIGATTVSVAVGALVAASLMTVRFGDYAQIIPHGNAEPVASAQLEELPLMAAAVAPAVEPVPVQAFEADQAIEIDLSEIEEIAPASQPVVIPELTVTSDKSAKLAKSKQVEVAAPSKAPKQRSKRGKRGRTMPAAISEAPPEPQLEAAAPAPETVESSPQPIAAATESQPEAVEPVAELAPPPPPAPVLPENLTRAQVKSGLDSVRAKVFACAHGTYGKILADVTISAPGQVSNTVIEGTFAGTKAAACMVEKIANAKFAAFSGPDISVRYPYSF
jgi:hypothetical protein